jgi:hypothetical protein
MKLKRLLGIAAASVVVAALGMPAQAQTRHDEKPHGPPKKAVKKSNIKQPAGGPRHDEKPHGAPAKADAEKK